MTQVFEQIARLINELTRRVESLESIEVGKWRYLTAPLTSTSWDGDAKTDIGKTKIDLSSVFSAPAGIKAVLVYVSVNDNDSAATDTYLILSPNDTALQGMAFSPMTLNDRPGRYSAVIPCNVDGDIYYQVEASAGLDVFLEIWGYAI